LQLARLVERITRNFGEKRLTGSVFLDVPKAFDTVWIDGLLYKLTLLPVLHSPYYLLIPPGSDVRSVLPDGHVISLKHAGWGGSGWIDLPCLLQSVCQRYAPPSHHVELALYAERHDHHSHVPQADAARQLPGVIPRRTSTVVV
jgi:hypothetical protein